MKTEITPEQAETLGAEYRKLMELAQEQLVQHRLWLDSQLKHIHPNTYGLTPEAHAQLIDEAQLIKLEMVRLEPAMKDGDKQTASVVYEYPDSIHAFLSRPDVPRTLSILMQGGMTIDADVPSIKV